METVLKVYQDLTQNVCSALVICMTQLFYSYLPHSVDIGLLIMTDHFVLFKCVCVHKSKVQFRGV